MSDDDLFNGLIGLIVLLIFATMTFISLKKCNHSTRRCHYEIVGAAHDCEQSYTTQCGQMLSCLDGQFKCVTNVKEFGCYDVPRK